MDLDAAFANLLSPPILFFALGMLARAVRSDLAIPETITKLFSLYLLWAIGFKGGVALEQSGLSVEALVPLVAAVVVSFLIPFAVYPVLRARFNHHDASAVAAAYGSVSVVTFITATNFLEASGIPYGGYMVAALALMESPAIVAAVLIHRMGDRRAGLGTETGGLKSAMHEAVVGGPVFLLVGSMLVGLITGQKGWETLEPFCDDIFHGVLVLFLLEAGMRAAKQLGPARRAGVFVVAVALVLPLVQAALGLGLARLVRMEVGDAFLFVILCASASYIAVPAAMRLAIPGASHGVLMPMALAITFPLNILVGIPFYLWAVQTVWTL